MASIDLFFPATLFSVTISRASSEEGDSLRPLSLDWL
jgi:hypothetical protein